MSVTVSVILPTYNEIENIPLIVPQIAETLTRHGYSFEILVMDDSSPDGTADAANALSDKYPVIGVKRTGTRGLSEAVMEGFTLAQGQVLVVMDADLSHPIEKLPEMIEPILKGTADITVGSRYIAGGGCHEWAFHRVFISRVSGFLAAGLTSLSDPTTGYMGVSKSILQGAVLDPVGWKIVLEVVARTGGRVKEIPIIFKDRIHGESKLTSTAQLQYLTHLWKLYGFKLPAILQFIKFCLVGASGLIIDTLLLIFCVELFSLNPQTAAVFAFSGAVSWNYVLNRRWTFNYALSFDRTYPVFVVVCLLGLSMRVGIMSLLLHYPPFSSSSFGYVLASFIGIVAGTGVNFLGSREFVFRENTSAGSVK